GECIAAPTPPHRLDRNEILRLSQSVRITEKNSTLIHIRLPSAASSAVLFVPRCLWLTDMSTPTMGCDKVMTATPPPPPPPPHPPHQNSYSTVRVAKTTPPGPIFKARMLL
ncbi:unnamed protein product, partial [Ectocarpus sp. 8 AP-2014]